MSDPREEARVEAAEQLSRVEFAKHIPGPQLKALTGVFVKGLGDARWQVRSSSARILGVLCAAETTEALVAAAGDAEKNVRASVVRGLAVMARDDERALDALIKLGRDPDSLVRQHAIPALGREWGRFWTDQQTAKIVSALTEMLKDGAADTRSSVLEAVRQLGANAAPMKQALEDLRAKTGADVGLQRHIAQVLGEIDADEKAVARTRQRLAELVASTRPEDRTAVWHMLAGVERRFPIREAVRAVRPLLEHPQNDAFLAAIRGLASMHEAADSIKYQGSVEAKEIEGLRSADAGARRAAVEAIVKLGPAGRTASFALVELLTKENDAAVRDAARRALIALWAASDKAGRDR
jgi:HEAT repeat protein